MKSQSQCLLILIFFFQIIQILDCKSPFSIPSFYLGYLKKNEKAQASKQFNPYVDNGGTVIALAGEEYCLIAADTRLSDNYCIRSRNISRIFPINENIALAGSGCWADIVGLVNTLKQQTVQYLWSNKEEIDCVSFAYLLSYNLYTRRMFPYFSFSLIGGIDKEGHGAVFKYDALGSFERIIASCSGKGEQLIQPLLDEFTKMESEEGLWNFEKSRTESLRRHFPLNESEAIDLVKIAFQSAAEREISVGDGIEIFIIRSSKGLLRLGSISEHIFCSLPAH